MAQLQNKTITLQVQDGDDIVFDIDTNMDDQTVYNAAICWAARTENYTAKSFCKYVNSKKSGDFARPAKAKA